MSEIIAKAMNSTLGTAKFVAFDKLMRYKSVDASDTPMITISENDCKTCTLVGNYNGTGQEATKWQYTDAVKFEIPSLSGTVKLVTKLATLCTNDANFYVEGVFTLVQNGVTLATINTEDRGNPSTDATMTDVVINDIVVQPGDVFILKLALCARNPASNYGGTMRIAEPIRINGTTRDYVGVNIL